ncbi:hypothetical protein ACJMK2_025307 [Sinanodonta woodiana]|uniref:Ig-like domain-containing protein n=1 Tax=Sinanodonta woodiana TaxID=1069815 RepID=A0ABD3XG26_SINWO
MPNRVTPTTLYSPPVTHLDPPVVFESMLVEVHSNTYLYCTSTLTVNHTWLHNGGSTLSPHVVASTSATGDAVLDIRDITRAEGGRYTCIISKDGVTARSSVMVSVIEENSPLGVLHFNASHTMTHRHMVLVFHDSASIDCVSQRNGVTYEWRFNRSLVLPPNVHANGRSLKIGVMTGAEVGNYTCIAYTHGLATSASVWVSVKEVKAHVSQMTTSSAHPVKAHQFNIVCHVVGYPEPAISWSFTDPMGQTVVPPGVSHPTPNKVHIQSFQPSLHSGTWTCMVRNYLGVDQKSIHI